MKRDKLVKFRGERSQFFMADQYSVTQQTWSNWEKGKSTPDIPTMKKIELDSGIPMQELFFDVFNKNNLLKTS